MTVLILCHVIRPPPASKFLDPSLDPFTLCYEVHNFYRPFTSLLYEVYFARMRHNKTKVQTNNYTKNTDGGNNSNIKKMVKRLKRVKIQ